MFRMLTNAVDELYGLQLVNAYFVHCCEKRISIFQVFAPEHEIDFISCEWALKFLSVEHFIFQLFNGLKEKEIFISVARKVSDKLTDQAMHFYCTKC